MLQKLKQTFLVINLAVLSATSFVLAAESNNAPGNKRLSRTERPVDIKIVPIGPTQEIVDQIKTTVERSAAVQKELGGTNYRLISFGYVDQDDKATVGKFDPQQFLVVFYDYTNDRTLVAQGAFASPENVRVFEDASKPVPSEEELDAAGAIVKNDPQFGSAIKSNRLRIFQAMPAISVDEKTGERFVNIGLESLDSSTRNEVVSVSFKRGEVVRYNNLAPPTSRAAPTACGIPVGSGGASGSTGQYQLTVSQNGTTLWEMLVIRPAASSGTNASGIEVRDVRYRGKMVLKRGHVPILDVQYKEGQCGPYRDWEDQEDGFQAPTTGATDPAPGIRLLGPGQIATTALESGNDTGNFKGVAVYTQNNDTVLVSEMAAGWYRYIMEWRFDNDGTIRPRYGFGATNNSCVCFVHNHHAYWRFDFDIVNPNNNIFQVERGRKFITPITTEKSLLRNYQTNRSLLIQNGSGDEAYMLTPNLTDGVVDAFGKSDFWILRYKNVVGGTPVQNEIDDGVTCVTCSGLSGAIQIDPYVNGESLENQDLVVWYGTHFVHADGANTLNPDRTGRTILSGSHVVGPDIRPIRW